MSVVLRVLLTLFLFSCQNKAQENVTSADKAEVAFNLNEVVAGMNLLAAIIDWPNETVGQQKNVGVTVEEAKTLILPLHPLWDEKVNVYAQLWMDLDTSSIKNELSQCQQNCSCDFYLSVLEINPEIISRDPEIKKFNELKIQRTKAATLVCLDKIPSLQNLMKYLKESKKDYEAPSQI